ncbi:hypothetical protein CPB84DRAFT_1790753 [Gymnopilus junonius]|uniref:Uncharacterized protein n=1 Tax=Gymnopilus junonius TaxID=109634 RepID=A0A9P5THT0_GYMJU|nr:hypothetical protein CPB84DRAFT_1790753 [Gymnopilus junonius]
MLFLYNWGYRRLYMGDGGDYYSNPFIPSHTYTYLTGRFPPYATSSQSSSLANALGP